MKNDKSVEEQGRTKITNLQLTILRYSPCTHQQKDCGKEGNLTQQNDVRVSL